MGVGCGRIGAHRCVGGGVWRARWEGRGAGGGGGGGEGGEGWRGGGGVKMHGWIT